MIRNLFLCDVSEMSAYIRVRRVDAAVGRYIDAKRTPGFSVKPIIGVSSAGVMRSPG